MKNFVYIISIVLSGIVAFSCNEDTLEPTLAQNKDVETSITSLEDLQGILYGAYNRMTHYHYYGRDYIIYGELRSDNCFANGNSARFLTTAAMDMGESDWYAINAWTKMYEVIANANIIIGKEAAEIEGDVGLINQITGQTYAIRALVHFDLLKLFGQKHVTGQEILGVPYIKEYKGGNITPEREMVANVKAFIEADLAKALSLMPTDLNGNSKEFITTHAVYAIQSRVALYFEDWATVVSASEVVINSGSYYIIPEANFVDSWTTKQAGNSIFELAFSNVDNNSINGLEFIYRGAGYGDVRVLDDLQAIFDSGDVRNSLEMIDFDPDAPTYLTNMGKYPATDYSDNIPLFRYEELVLNYAEALFEINPADPDALTYLNMVPAQRGANLYTVVTKDNILQERRKELCFEGFRFDDLARTGRDIPLVDPVRQRHGGPVYGSYNYAFPIPKLELNANAKLEQNYGY